MALISYLISLLLWKHACSLDSESIESYNGIEVSPFYDAIIFSDIADIISEFESNNIPILKFARNESESDEEVDDLLSEYQQYLEKAHKQTKDYVEKGRLKNKVPLIRHERYFKPHSMGNNGKLGDVFYKSNYGFNPDALKYPRNYDPYDMFLPLNSKRTPDNTAMSTFNKFLLGEEKTVLPAVPVAPYYQRPRMNPACYCKSNQLPCSCACKQCLLPLSSPHSNDYTIKVVNDDRISEVESFPLKNFKRNNRLTGFLPDDTLNIRIKVDLELPSSFDGKLTQNVNGRVGFDKPSSNELFPSMSVPTPYFNFPIPMNMFGFKKNIPESSLHKITVHKKKKPKPANGSKKHRKKVITFHNIKLDPQQLYEAHFGKMNISGEKKNMTNSSNSSINVNSSTTANVDKKFSTLKLPIINETQTEENVILLVNISHTPINSSDEIKLGNSAEVDDTNIITNTNQTKTYVHSIMKRDAISTTTNVVTHTTRIPFVTTTKGKKVSNSTKSNEKKFNKKNDKTMPSDTELLYWPKNTQNVSSIITKNITTIILENEYKKSKINISNEAYRKNHTIILERAIFGDVNWNEINAVAPAVMSFVGKYLKGVLTFCSEKICNSMKCERKRCMYRVCNPHDRINNKGHCTGFNNTESVTSLESIMDLPSKVAFELVDILKDRMMGKLFGKVTLCINAKCITFAASKKMFIQHKCTMKELNQKGHCIVKDEKSA